MATVSGYAPKKGHGQVVNIIGEGFRALTGTVEVKFSNTVSPQTDVRNDRHVQARVPNLTDGTTVSIALCSAENPSGLFVGQFIVGQPSTDLQITDVFPEPVQPNQPVHVLGTAFPYQASGGSNDVDVTFYLEFGQPKTVKGLMENTTVISVTAPPASADLMTPKCNKITVNFPGVGTVEAPKVSCYP